MEAELIVYIVLGLILFVGSISIVAGSVFTVRTQHAAIIEKFGKFQRVEEAGLNFKVPFIESVRIVSLETFQLDGKIETKTKDNVFVELPVSVQYRVIDRPPQIADSYYKLTNTKAQIESYLYNILLAHIPETDLDEVFLTQPQIAARATKELSDEMLPFGYEIVKVLITDIIPDEGVKAAMNRINEMNRLSVANKAQGDAEYILKTRQAEADAEVLHQNGIGISKERSAIADGLTEAIDKIADGTGVSKSVAMNMLLFTNWTAMMKEVGSSKNSTMVFMPSGPEVMTNFATALNSSLLTQLSSEVKKS